MVSEITPDPFIDSVPVSRIDGTPLGPPLRFHAAAALAAVNPDDPRSLPVLIEGLVYDIECRGMALEYLGKLGPRAKATIPTVNQVANGTLGYSHERLPLTSQKGYERVDRQDAKAAIRKIEGH